MNPLAVLALLFVLATAVDAAPRRYIVEFRDSHAVAGEPRAVTRFRDAMPRTRVRHEFRRVLDGVAIELDDAAIDAVRALPYVDRITPDVEVVAFDLEAGQVSDALAPASQLAGTGAGVTVAVIDSGIDYTHPALGAGFGPGFKVAGGWDFVNDDADPMDDYRHGTHVAGIIAANSAAMSGLAPGATLLAYKVLGHTGSGLTSDVIAAIERALDPNGDGNLDDRADVINLSLGSPGHADDPQSRAVAQAVAAGAVVVASAGNTGTFHSIGSPAVAPAAIAVGATTGANVADFSSAGPAAGSGDVKPDLLAPGTSIRSTLPGGNYGQLSGTSMAAPHVAAMAARLLEQHPDWTPARVKAALVATASPVAASEVMAQGAGRASLTAAAGNELWLAPAQLNFGNDGILGASWQSVRTVILRNDSNVARTIAVQATGERDGIALALPAPFTLAAGASQEITFTLAVDNTIVRKPASESMSFGGHIAFTWDGGSAALPWAFVRAARAVVSFGDAFAQIAWDIPAGTLASAAVANDRAELLVEPGDYGLVIATVAGDTTRLIARESQHVEGDLLLAFSDADTPHEVRLATFPDAATTPTTLFSRWVRLVSGSRSIDIPMPGRSLRAATIGGNFTLLMTEAVVDAGTREIRIAQHPPLTGIASDHVLDADASEFASQALVLHHAGNASGREVRIMPREAQRIAQTVSGVPESLTIPFTGSSWDGTLFMTRERHPDFASGVQLSVRSDGDAEGVSSYFTPIIRRDADGFFATRNYAPSGAAERTLAGEAMEFGGGVVHPSIPFVAQATGLAGTIELRGDRDELRRRETLSMQYRVVDRESGQQLSQGAVIYGTSHIPLPRAGSLHVSLTTEQLEIAGRNGSGAMHLFFDTRRGETTLPVITSMAVLDGSGRHAGRLVHNGNGALVFSLQHAQLAGLFFRIRGRQTWTQLTPVAFATDELRGTLYRADLGEALRFADEIELRLEATGANDSALVWEVGPAFISETGEPGRKRRSVGR